MHVSLPLLARLRRWLPLLLVLLLALALRLALWGQLPREGLISDEAEYLAAADWLAQGRGFAWHQGWLWTRAPLYPLFLAAHIALFGFALTPIFVSQTILSLLNVALVYLLARQVVGATGATGAAAAENAPATQLAARWLPPLAALLTALYLPFALYPQLILSETLYITLLLATFALLGRWSQCRGLLLLALAGGLLGLACLTRGLTLGFVPLVVLWVWFQAHPARPWQHWRRRAAGAGLLLLVCAGTILPWSLYASRAYGGPIVVDTTGAFNLLLGARTAYDGGRSDAPTRSFLLALLDDSLSDAERHALLDEGASCLYQRDDPHLLAALDRPASAISHAERQRLLTAEGLCLLRATPGAFVAKSLRELVDLFQINYTGSERLSGGFSLGRLPAWYALALFLLDDTLYVLLLPLAIVGWARLRLRGGIGLALTALVGLWWLYNLGTAPLLFAINRFRIPLLPFACIFAVAALLPLWRVPRAALVRSAAVLAALLAVVALTPYAYLQAPPAAWSSYLGPYPSSLCNTAIAWDARSTFLREQRLIAALGRGDAAAARAILAANEPPAQAMQHTFCTDQLIINRDSIPRHTLRLALPLLEGLAGDPAAGLALLPDAATLERERDWRAAVVRGDLLRRLGDEAAAKAAFTPGYVDDQNPVAWAWRWLHPPPTQQIDLGGNLDLGYIQGFYLGEGDPSADGTFRWSSAEARLLFPGQGQPEGQQVCLRADGRGWPPDLPMPTFTLALAASQDAPADAPFARHTLQRAVHTYCAELPPTAAGADLVLVLRSPTFVPPAADLLAQQGPQAGQLRLLGVRLDWVELGGTEAHRRDAE
jgi:4-amino-4-deoxy-L-arabinose transferase-like glycosyltransferase